MSYATVTTSNMELTPMRVTYNGVDLGGTLANVVISAKYAKSNILADQSGSTVRDRRVSGVEITVTTELSEIKNKDILHFREDLVHAVSCRCDNSKICQDRS